MKSANVNCLFRKISDTETVCYGRFAAMHTRFDIMLWGAGLLQTALGGIVENLFSVVKYVEKMANRFDPASDVSLLNQGDDRRVSTELLQLLAICEEGRLLTSGYFNIGAGDVKYDLSGVAKGYVLEQIRPLVCAYDSLNVLASAGNSSVLAVGHAPGRDCWPVSLTVGGHHVFELRNECLTTSGVTRGMNPHIINPLTGSLVERYGLVSVVTDNAVWGEILSTALFASSTTDREAILQRIPHRVAVFADSYI